jgi:class 3 adenylate cyclase/tetratricopeptide (TPR) repeat protein
MRFRALTTSTTPCARCGFANPEGFRFCGHCGSPLSATPAAGPAAGGHAEPDEAERRQLTVMFCDLVGSTALSERLDPEELRELVRAYQTTAAGVIDRLGGHVAQYLGDGILVYFGYPRAHEDDARRAVLAGLGIVSEIAGLDLGLFRRAEIRPAVRVGIHTGEVVAGEIGAGSRTERLALGRTPNLAARLQEIAEPNMVAVSAATRRLVERHFVLEPLGTFNLKGISEPIEAFQPVREVRHALGPEPDDVSDRMPLVNRHHELELLKRRLAMAAGGTGQVVLVRAEAGLGKSRLIQALHQSLDEEELTWLTGSCLPYAQNAAFTPFITILAHAFGLRPEEGPRLRLQRMERLLTRLGLDPEPTVSLLAPLLELPVTLTQLPPRLSAEQRKRRTVDAIVKLLARLAATQPLALVIEDLHWIDPSSLELLGIVIEALRDLPALVLLSFRPGFVPPWSEDDRTCQIRLARLSRENVEEMVTHVTGGRGLPETMLQRVVSRTDGVPLFVEELTKMLLESGLLRTIDDPEPGRPHPSDLTIPTTLRDSLTARLDLLGSGKEIAQIAAVIGREFSFEVLQAASGRNRASLAAELERLVGSELLQRRGDPPDATYTFRHALIQEAALGSLLRSTRREYHRRVALAYEQAFPRMAAGRPEELGHHWSRALEHDRSAHYYALAADRSKATYANQEAIAFYLRALDELRAILRSGETPSRDLLSTTARIYESLSDVLTLTGQREEARSSLRAALTHLPDRDPIHQARLHRKEGAIWIAEHEDLKALATLATAEQVLGAEPMPDRAIWWHEWIQIRLEKLWTHYYKARLAEMNELVEELSPRIEEVATPVQRTRFFTILVGFHLRRARYRLSDQIRTEARALLAAAEEMGDLQEIASARFTLGFVLLFSGMLDEAETLLQAAVAGEEQIGDTDYLPAARSYLSLTSRLRFDVDETESRAERALQTARRLQQPLYEGTACANLAWVAWRRGQTEQARALVDAAVGCWQRSGITFSFRWTALMPLMDLDLEQGRIEAAMATAASMLEPEQQLLDERLSAALEKAVAWRRTHEEADDRAAELLRHALELAHEVGCL